MSKSFIVSLAIIILLAIAGALGLLFRNEIGAFLGLTENKPPAAQNLSGQSISIDVGGQKLTIPPVLSYDILSYLKKELTENAGMPLKVERKGNSLPFGIP